MSVALVSLFPLDATGGGELFTVETAQAIRAAGQRTFIAAPVLVPPPRAPLAARLGSAFVWAEVGADVAPCVIEWSEVLARLADHDVVCAHQYLAADLIFDLIATIASDQQLLFTSLGFEPVRGLFEDLYQTCPGHHFVEISTYAAQRATRYAPRAMAVRAGIWRDDISRDARTHTRAHAFIALGRVLPHKGLETTIDALPPESTLDVVGPTPDEAYLAFLRTRAQGKPVQFHGCLPRADVGRLLRQSTALVSSSTHRLYDGRRIEQPELLGLVLCEALRDGTLPVASDVPASVEVMTLLGRREWTYLEGEPSSLRAQLERLGALDGRHRAQQLADGRRALLREFCWDDYWHRVTERIQEYAQCA